MSEEASSETQNETLETSETSEGQEEQPESLLSSKEEEEEEATEPFKPFEADKISALFPEEVQKDLSEDGATKFAEVLNKHQVGEDAAKDIAKLYYETIAEAAEASHTQFAEFQRVQQEAVRNDAEIGGEKLDENLSVARSVLKDYADPKLLEQVNVTGLGNNVHFIKFLLSMRKAVPGEAPPPASSSQQSEGQKTLANRFYSEGT